MRKHCLNFAQLVVLLPTRKDIKLNDLSSTVNLWPTLIMASYNLVDYDGENSGERDG